MPRIKRWFPVSHDINGDAEVWAMRKEIGEKSLSIWLEILSIADRNESRLPGDYDQLIRLVSGRCQSTVIKVSAVLDYAKSRLWLKSEPCLRVAKWAEYHKTRGPNQIPRGNRIGNKQAPSEPSEPSEPNLKKVLSSDCPKKPELSVRDFCDSWNEYFRGKLPMVRMPLAISRERKLKARLRDHPELQFWKDVFSKVWTSDFLMGRNGHSNSHWKASFDWIITNDTNVLKIIEGNYANKDR